MNSDAEIPTSEHLHTITVPVPSGAYSHVSFVKVYATCRLRRIWLSEAGSGQMLPLEFDLYGQ